MKRIALIFVVVMTAVTATASNLMTYVDDFRGFSVAHPTTWPRSTRGESVCFESPEGPTVSMNIQPLSSNDNNYTSVYQIPDAENELLKIVKSMPGTSTFSVGRTKLSGRDAFWIKYRYDHESLDATSVFYSYQVVTLTSRGLLYCNYMAGGTSDQEAKANYNRVWKDAVIIMRSVFIHP